MERELQSTPNNSAFRPKRFGTRGEAPQDLTAVAAFKSNALDDSGDLRTLRARVTPASESHCEELPFGPRPFASQMVIRLGASAGPDVSRSLRRRLRPASLIAVDRTSSGTCKCAGAPEVHASGGTAERRSRSRDRCGGACPAVHRQLTGSPVAQRRASSAVSAIRPPASRGRRHAHWLRTRRQARRNNPRPSYGLHAATRLRKP